MKKAILKDKFDLARFEKDSEYHFYKTPEEYPCIAVMYIKNSDVRWSSDGFKINQNYDVEFIYLKQIQKELYDNDFEQLVK